MGQITVFSGPERRRRWSEDERQQILKEAFSAGACVSHVARRHDISTGLIYTWRRKQCRPVTEPGPSTLLETGFAEAVVVNGGGADPPELQPAIVIELAGGRRVSIFASASSSLAAAALKALR